MKIIIVLFFMLCFLLPSQAEETTSENDFALGLLSTGKMTGACGIFKLQIEFQENTKLTGGNTFIERFWKTEATRLGMSLEEYAKQCKIVSDNYQQYFKIFESMDSKN